jgi:Terminase large subunit, T4likevirus-type, N-terminal
VIARKAVALTLDPTLFLAAQGLMADPWQRELLFSQARFTLLNCSRGAGKTRVTSVLALHTALFQPNSLVLLVSRAQRQARELLRYCKQGYHAAGQPVRAVKYNAGELEFANGSRIIALPGSESTIRGYQGVNLLILDEAARIPNDLIAAVSPMVAVARGRQIWLSTPFGKAGTFWREWHDLNGPWVRFRIPWQHCLRLDAAFIEDERRRFGESWVAQEYECSFEKREGLVYPDFAQALVASCPAAGDAYRYGGIDWGWHAPFAAVWGFRDHDDVLWIEGERYLRGTSLQEHAAALPRRVDWYADPESPTEADAFRLAGHKVHKAFNGIRLGIQAVTARLRTGRLRVVQRSCPNLCNEAGLYRYPSADEKDADSEKPVDADNHALDALRYLVCGIDQRFIAKQRAVNVN